MQSLKEVLSEYQAQHQSPGNRVMHSIGIPAIIIGALILLSWISVSIVGRWHITFAWIAIILALIYYYRLDIRLAAVMTVVLVIITLICSWIGYPRPTTFNFILFIILFVGGWILLFVGHAIEKTKPAFTTNLFQLLIAPLYLLIKLLAFLKLDRYFSTNEEP